MNITFLKEIEMFFQQGTKHTLSKKRFSFHERDPRFLNEVINKIKKDFIEGPAYSRQHKKIKDHTFIRPSNTIPDTHFFAAAGPKNEEDLINFFKDTLFREPPISCIVALGNRLSETDTCHKGIDFLNYYMKESSYDIGSYHVSREYLGGRFRQKNEESRPDVYAESELTVSDGKENKSIKVIGVELKDGTCIDLNNDHDDRKKEILWKIFRLSVEGQVYVHCKHGHGRTGHLILTMEILNQYSRVFLHDDPDYVAERIREILDNMRQQRPGLVHTEKQMTMAITNAITLSSYAREKGYEFPAPDLTRPTAFATFTG